MWATGRVRDRAVRAAAKRRWGSRFFRACPEKWWGPVVLDAAPKPTSPSDFCERDLSNLSRANEVRGKTHFLQRCRMPPSALEGTNGHRKEH